MRVIFLGLPQYAEREMLDGGLDIDYIHKLSLHEGEVCDALLSIMVDENEWEDNYYDLFFADGFRFYECSGLHLERIE